MKSSPYLFFIKNAGYSYDPKKETPFKGRVRCARALAEAEKRASAEGCSFEWEQDDSTNREWTDEGAEYYTWRCLMRDSLGVVLGSLCGVDFGEGGEPWDNPYRRVVEAEIASEALS
jgi:hypothetical protein